LQIPRLTCDLEIPIAGITGDLYSWLARFAPFGNANPEPVFASRGVKLCAAPRIIKERHICLQLEQPGTSGISALGWSRAPSGSSDWPARCAELALAQRSVVDLAYRIRRNAHAQFGGIELELCEIAIASG
jgi:single-stranded-DNA-specific exonuclease